jgi:membrane-associated phospholipid phosphatase
LSKPSPVPRSLTSSPKLWLVSGTVSFGLFVALGVLVAGHPLALDLMVAGGFQGLWREAPGRVATVVSDAFGIVVPAVFPISLAVAVALTWYRGLRRQAAIAARVLVVFMLCRLVSAGGKPLFVRTRPRAYPDFSYPSGHVVAAASTGLAAVLLCVWLAPRLTRWAAGATVVITVLVAVTRLVLGVHWLTDTVGAVLGVLGVGLLTAMSLRLLPGPVSEPGSTA